MDLQSNPRLSMEEIASIVDLVFPVRGGSVAADHGYLLYAALSQSLPAVHLATWLAVHPLPGQFVAKRLHMPSRACLTLRIPASHVPTLLPLAGRTLQVGTASIVLGAPSIRALCPAASLRSRVVAIRLTEPPSRADGTLDLEQMAAQARAEMQRQLSQNRVSAQLTLGKRRSLTVSGRRFVGWAARLDGLSALDSLVVQANGIGGKRTMGCGVFVPTRPLESSVQHAQRDLD